MDKDDDTYCIFNGKDDEINTDLILIRLVHYFPDLQFYSLNVDKEKPDQYKVSCVSPDSKFEFQSNDIDEMIRRLLLDFYAGTVPHTTPLLHFTALEHGANSLMGVIDDSMTDEEQSAFIANLKAAYKELTKEQKSKLVFSWVEYKSLSEYDRRFIKKEAVPFVFVKQGDRNWTPQYFIAPGVDCYEKLTETVTKTTTKDQIYSFASKYLNGEFIPNHLRNENKTASLEASKSQANFFSNSSTVIKKINAADLEQLARSDKAHNFLVISCEWDFNECRSGNEGINEIVRSQNITKQIYFMDSFYNEVYMRDLPENNLQRRVYGFKSIGLYFKSFKDLSLPESKHGDRSLDGLLTFQHT